LINLVSYWHKVHSVSVTSVLHLAVLATQTLSLLVYPVLQVVHV
jgi:hypothetical protein